jgi:hypothetical protein
LNSTSPSFRLASGATIEGHVLRIDLGKNSRVSFDAGSQCNIFSNGYGTITTGHFSQQGNIQISGYLDVDTQTANFIHDRVRGDSFLLKLGYHYGGARGALTEMDKFLSVTYPHISMPHLDLINTKGLFLRHPHLSGTFRHVYNSGFIHGRGYLTLNAQGQFTNTGIVAANGLVTTSTHTHRNYGILSGGNGDNVVMGKSIESYNAHYRGKNVLQKADGDIIHQGVTINSTQHTSLQGTNITLAAIPVIGYGPSGFYQQDLVPSSIVAGGSLAVVAAGLLKGDMVKLKSGEDMYLAGVNGVQMNSHFSSYRSEGYDDRRFKESTKEHTVDLDAGRTLFVESSKGGIEARGAKLKGKTVALHAKLDINLNALTTTVKSADYVRSLFVNRDTKEQHMEVLPTKIDAEQFSIYSSEGKNHIRSIEIDAKQGHIHGEKGNDGRPVETEQISSTTQSGFSLSFLGQTFAAGEMPKLGMPTPTVGIGTYNKTEVRVSKSGHPGYIRSDSLGVSTGRNGVSDFRGMNLVGQTKPEMDLITNTPLLLTGGIATQTKSYSENTEVNMGISFSPTPILTGSASYSQNESESTTYLKGKYQIGHLTNLLPGAEFHAGNGIDLQINNVSGAHMSLIVDHVQAKQSQNGYSVGGGFTGSMGSFHASVHGGEKTSSTELTNVTIRDSGGCVTRTDSKYQDYDTRTSLGLNVSALNMSNLSKSVPVVGISGGIGDHEVSFSTADLKSLTSNTGLKQAIAVAGAVNNVNNIMGMVTGETEVSGQINKILKPTIKTMSYTQSSLDFVNTVSLALSQQQKTAKVSSSSPSEEDPTNSNSDPSYPEMVEPFFKKEDQKDNNGLLSSFIPGYSPVKDSVGEEMQSSPSPLPENTLDQDDFDYPSLWAHPSRPVGEGQLNSTSDSEQQGMASFFFTNSKKKDNHSVPSSLIPGYHEDSYFIGEEMPRFPSTPRKYILQQVRPSLTSDLKPIMVCSADISMMPIFNLTNPNPYSPSFVISPKFYSSSYPEVISGQVDFDYLSFGAHPSRPVGKVGVPTNSTSDLEPQSMASLFFKKEKKKDDSDFLSPFISESSSPRSFVMDYLKKPMMVCDSGHIVCDSPFIPKTPPYSPVPVSSTPSFGIPPKISFAPNVDKEIIRHGKSIEDVKKLVQTTPQDTRKGKNIHYLPGNKHGDKAIPVYFKKVDGEVIIIGIGFGEKSKTTTVSAQKASSPSSVKNSAPKKKLKEKTSSQEKALVEKDQNTTVKTNTNKLYLPDGSFIECPAIRRTHFSPLFVAGLKKFSDTVTQLSDSPVPLPKPILKFLDSKGLRAPEVGECGKFIFEVGTFFVGGAPVKGGRWAVGGVKTLLTANNRRKVVTVVKKLADTTINETGKTLGKSGTKYAIRKTEAEATRKSAEQTLRNRARNAANNKKLRFDLAIEQQKKEIGTIIAGKGTKHPINDIKRLVHDFGGKPEDWVKKSSKKYRSPADGKQFETHWYENPNLPGKQKRFDFKTKITEIVNYE